MDLWEELLKKYDEILYIPMSSGLSSSCDTAMGLAMEFEGKVRVVNNQRISVTQRQSVLDAIELAEKGMSVQKIEEVLMREKLESSIYITVDTLKYFKKRWTYHTGSGSYRYCVEFKTGSSDSRR